MTDTRTAVHHVDAVERLGRRLKMEYVGMASGFFVIFLLLLPAHPAAARSAWAASWLSDAWLFPSPVWGAILATAGLFALFIGIKKKTEDHLSASFLLMATALTLRLGQGAPGAAVSVLCLGALLYAMEGAVESRRNRIFALPLVFWLWAQAHPAFLPGLVMLFAYLLPAPGREVNRPRIAVVGALCALAACIHPLKAGVYPAAAQAMAWGAVSVSHGQYLAAVSAGVIALLLVAVFGRTLLAAHRANLVLTAILSVVTPYGVLFAPIVTVGLAATLFRKSIRFDDLRPTFKRVEWYYFWLILLVAVVCLTQLPHWTYLAARAHHG
ncbi:MAG: hypothetical protein JSV65_07580 [Armatimonadota bacterium]|nr:MAG: hypothetical protein JSV65_07580 [Armatimonadota bacterium]